MGTKATKSKKGLGSKKALKIKNGLRAFPKKIAGAVVAIFKGILSLPRIIFRFLKSVRQELKHVEWLSRKQTARWATAVITTALVIGGTLALLDYVFFLLRDLLFKKL